MTKRSIRQLKDREWAMLLIAVGALALLLVYRFWLLPAYRQLSHARAQVQAQVANDQRLRSNLAARDSVNKTFASLGDHVFQQQSDQLTLSSWLRDLEALARRSSLNLMNMKPQPVQREPSYQVYGVKLSASGQLPQILQFISAATHNDAVTGLESFSLRGLPSGNMVECSLSLSMVRLPAPSTSSNQHSESSGPDISGRMP